MGKDLFQEVVQHPRGRSGVAMAQCVFVGKPHAIRIQCMGTPELPCPAEAGIDDWEMTDVQARQAFRKTGWTVAGDAKKETTRCPKCVQAMKERTHG
jgi:hypothetical protein